MALIDADGRVLLAERPAGKHWPGLWEFPGGKVQPGETPEAALIRELDEELGIDVRGELPRAVHLRLARLSGVSPADAALCLPQMVGDRRRRAKGQRLNWVRPARLADYPMPPADKPLVAMLRDLL